MSSFNQPAAYRTGSAPDMRAWWRDPLLGARREVGLPQGRVAVFDSGAGEPVLFVHGLLSNANLWRYVVPRLSHEFRCVTVDLPFGAHTLAMPRADLTPPGLAGLVTSVIENLGLGKVTLVGCDNGGAICQMVVATRPDLVRRLVLASSDAYEVFPQRLTRNLQLIARVPGLLGPVMTTLRLPWVRRLPFVFGWLTSSPIPRDADDAYALPAASARDIREDLRRVVHGIHPRHTLSAAQRFGEFTQPVLIAWSNHDRLFPGVLAQRLAADFPNSRLEWIADSRTFSPEDQPARLATLIADFVRETSPVEVELQ